jgi:hypothetical protein
MWMLNGKVANPMLTKMLEMLMAPITGFDR